MNRNMRPELNPVFFDEVNLWDLIESVVGKGAMDFNLDAILAPLGLPFKTIDPIYCDITAAVADSNRAAFLAGLAVGRDPSILLFKQGKRTPRQCGVKR